MSEFSSEVFALRLNREGARSGELQISLIWNDIADLDLHVHAPDDEHIYYGNKQAESGGWLDVDMNVRAPGPGSNNSLEPVENVFWHSSPSGDYKVVVHNFRCHCDESTVFTDPNRLVPFRCIVKRGGKTETFDGKVKAGSPVTAFEFEHQGTGAVGSYVVLPDHDEKTTFKEACARHNVSYNIGTGYYAVARMEKIQKYKKLLLHHIESDTFTIGCNAVKKKLGWPLDVDLKKKPADIPEGYRLFVQSTSANRVIKPGTHVLVKVDMEEALRFRAASLAAQTAALAEKNASGGGGGEAGGAKKKAAAKKKTKAAAPAKSRKRKSAAVSQEPAAEPAPAPAPAPAKRGRKKKAAAATAAAPAPAPAPIADGGDGGEFQRFEHGGSKFWQVKVEGADMVVEYGAVGAKARESRKTLASAEKAQKEMEKMIKAKTKKGYEPV